MSLHRPLAVAHVVGAMNRAGVETWLMNLARRTNPDDVQYTFVKHTSIETDYDQEILSLGHRIAVVSATRNPARYALQFFRLLREGDAQFDAVHSHVNHFSALPLFVAWAAGIPVRIAHGHSDNRPAQKAASPVRRAYFAVASLVIRAFSTTGLASSEGACESLFRRRSQLQGAFQVLPTGIDLSGFPYPPAALRDELKLAPGVVLVGHVGRFVEVKNHKLLLEMVQVWRDTAAAAHLVLVGDGPLRSTIEQGVERADLTDLVSFLGVRSDVPHLLSALDVLVLPSHYEGVPVTLLEAQASGCPSLVSSTVTEAVDVVSGLITRIGILDNASAWASESLRLAREARGGDRREAAAVMNSSRYNIDVTLGRLLRLWSEGRAHGGQQ